MELEINKQLDGDVLNINLVGRLNTITAPDLERILNDSYASIKKLVLDFKDLEYISSAGLRVVLAAHKALDGNVIIRNVNDSVMEVFEMTGFTNIVTIE